MLSGKIMIYVYVKLPQKRSLDMNKRNISQYCDVHPWEQIMLGELKSNFDN